MKRLRYISRAADHLTQSQIQEIAHTSSQNNKSKGLTGFLVYFEGVFFQILEGDEKAVDDFNNFLIKYKNQSFELIKSFLNAIIDKN